MLEQMRRVGIEPTTYTNNRRDGQPDSPAPAQDAAPESGAKRARTLPPNATETQSRLPFLPVRTCGCGEHALVGRANFCPECRRTAQRQRMARARQFTPKQLPQLAALPPFSKYTQHGTFRCQFRKPDGTQCQHSRPHGANVCATHRGIA